MTRFPSAIVLALALCAAGPARAECPPPPVLERERVSILTKSAERSGDKQFLVEIADSDAARSAGLMCRKELVAGHGMLFVYPRAHVVRMWMKNTYIPLDMFFISGDGRIVKIVADIAPQQAGRISSGERVKMVLELAAGTAKRHGIRVGDKLRRPPPSPPAVE